MTANSKRLTMGPVLFNWPVAQWRDFYFRIADEAPVDRVYLGEVICSKRTPFFEPLYPEIVERLQRAGKEVVLSTLAEVMIRRDRQCVQALCETEGVEIEANDVSALDYVQPRPHSIGSYLNVYNEETLRHLALRGARHFCLPPELPFTSLQVMAAEASALQVALEVQVFGRYSLALSARCYHARAHDKTKDSCQYVCDQDPDGLVLNTVTGTPFLAINGIQTLSHAFLNLLHEMQAMSAAGIQYFRLSPQTQDMVQVSWIFRDLLDEKCAARDADARLQALAIPAPFSNGFYHGRPGYIRVVNA